MYCTGDDIATSAVLVKLVVAEGGIDVASDSNTSFTKRGLSICSGTSVVIVEAKLNLPQP